MVLSSAVDPSVLVSLGALVFAALAVAVMLLALLYASRAQGMDASDVATETTRTVPPRRRIR